jgi:hypothetical protein
MEMTAPVIMETEIAPEMCLEKIAKRVTTPPMKRSRATFQVVFWKVDFLFRYSP